MALSSPAIVGLAGLAVMCLTAIPLLVKLLRWLQARQNRRTSLLPVQAPRRLSTPLERINHPVFFNRPSIYSPHYESHEFSFLRLQSSSTAEATEVNLTSLRAHRSVHHTQSPRLSAGYVEEEE
ncbi:hypothetical protein F4780DRAFT_725558 [Xylariomycetidae sp. FL0641]|nr:hypothetical protein F4780DRAFT_725558 [Xylariomycetidae sp. FL0641]